jgi:hypothetical protein
MVVRYGLECNGRTRLQGNFKSGYYKHVESGGVTLGQAVAIHRGMDGIIGIYRTSATSIHNENREGGLGPCEKGSPPYLRQSMI